MALQRPFPLTWRVVLPSLLLLVFVPGYVFMPEFAAAHRTGRHPVGIEICRCRPVVIYASHLLFLLVLALILRDEAHGCWAFVVAGFWLYYQLRVR